MLSREWIKGSGEKSLWPPVSLNNKLSSRKRIEMHCCPHTLRISPHTRAVETSFQPSLWMCDTLSHRSTRGVNPGPGKQIQPLSVAVGIFPGRQSPVSTEDPELCRKLSLLYELSTQLRICWHKRLFVCVCVCVRGWRVRACLCVSVCWGGYTQELRNLQLSQWDVNIYDTLFAIWYVWTLSPSDICLRYLHIHAALRRIVKWNQKSLGNLINCR